MENLIIAVEAVVPFVFYIAFGYLSRQIHFTDEKFLKQLNQIVFKLFFPFVMFCNLSEMDPHAAIDGRFLGVCIGSLFLLTALLLATVPRMVTENARRGVVVQAIYRSNTILFALPLVQHIFGDSSTAFTAVVLAFMVPLYNILAVVILEHFSSESGRTPFSVLLKKVATNPIILGAVAGILYLFLPFSLPGALLKPINAISSMTTPLALFTLGGTLQLGKIGENAKVLSLSLAFKMVLLPALAIAFSRLLGFSSLETFVLFVLFATPVAASSFPMAASMGGDADLAGEFVAVSTVVSVPTLFLWILFMKNTGII